MPGSVLDPEDIPMNEAQSQPSKNSSWGGSTLFTWQHTLASATNRSLHRRLWETTRGWLTLSRGGGQAGKASQVTPGSVVEHKQSLTGSKVGKGASRCQGLEKCLENDEQLCGTWEGARGVVVAEEADEVGRGPVLWRAYYCVLENVGFILEEMGYHFSWMTSFGQWHGRANDWYNHSPQGLTP